MKMITCITVQKIFAAASFLATTLLSGCHSPGSHSVENPYYSSVALPGTATPVEPEPEPKKETVDSPEPTPLLESVSTDSKAVTVGSPEESKAPKTVKTDHNPWHFSREWWDR